MTDSDQILVSRTTLARLFACSVRQINMLENAAIIAPHQRGRGGKASTFDVGVVVPNYVRHLQSVGDGTASAAEARRRVAVARAALLELRLRRESGQLVNLADVRSENADIATAVKARLRAVPDSVADQVAGLSPAAVKVLLLSRIDDALRELARLATGREARAS